MLVPVVTERLDRYLQRMDAAYPDVLAGFYLVGSIALGDYRPGQSDIDFIAVIAEPLTSSELAGIAAIHSEVSKVGAPALDGFYIEEKQVKQTPDPHFRRPCVHDDVLRLQACFEVNPVAWQIWRDHGVALRGPASADLSLHLDPASIDRFERDNLQGYWGEWIERHRRQETPLNADQFGWVLATSARKPTPGHGRSIISRRDGIRRSKPPWRRDGVSCLR